MTGAPMLQRGYSVPHFEARTVVKPAAEKIRMKAPHILVTTKVTEGNDVEHAAA